MSQLLLFRSMLILCAISSAFVGCTTNSQPAAASAGAKGGGFTPLFPSDGVPKGWRVGAWDDVSKPGPTGAVWMVKEGVLHGSEPRGSWLMSEREYGDF